MSGLSPWPAFPRHPHPKEPLQVLTRAGTMLRMAQQGLRNMADADQEQVLLGFLSVAVFGRGVTSALQNLRHFDRPAFDTWYQPWLDEMNADPLCRFFYKLRSDVLKGISPLIGIVLATHGQSAVSVGSVVIPDLPSPTVHRGKPIEDASMLHLCSLYVAYLGEMFESASGVVIEVQDRWQSLQQV